MFEEGPAGLGYTYQGMLKGRVKGGGEERTGEEQEEAIERRKGKRRYLHLSRGWSVHLLG